MNLTPGMLFIKTFTLNQDSNHVKLLIAIIIQRQFMSKEPNLKTAELEKISHLDYFNIAISVDCVIFGYENKELKFC